MAKLALLFVADDVWYATVPAWELYSSSLEGAIQELRGLCFATWTNRLPKNLDELSNHMKKRKEKKRKEKSSSIY